MKKPIFISSILIFVLFLFLAVAPNLGPRTLAACLPNGSTCMNQGDCCSKLCEPVAGGMPGYCKEKGGGGGNTIFCEGDSEAIYTAIGCIPFGDQNQLMAFLLRWAIGIGGGIAFILIIVAGFQIMTSQGDPKRLQAGQELLTSAIGGLILLIFSVFVLRVIGVDILQIPGFGK